MRLTITFLIILFLAGNAASQEVKAVKVTELETLIRDSKTPLIINLWATWCKPCVEELPHFQKLAAAYQQDSVQLLLVSLDFKESFPAAVQQFMKKRSIRAKVVWLDETNADYFCPRIDTGWSGAIPATLFINNKTGYRKFAGEQLSEEELQREIMALLGKKQL